MEKKNNKSEFQSGSINSKALETRSLQNKKSLRDFDEWSLNLLPEMSLDSTILDLGCGLGKQVNLFSKFLSSHCKYYALDISRESINKLRKNYDSSPKLITIVDSFENAEKCIIKDEKFDLIYSFYALYYTKHLKQVIQFGYDKLDKGGHFWIVSPFEGTNEELFNILQKMYTFDDTVLYSINKFYLDTIKIAYAIGFKQIKVNKFNNTIFYSNVDELYSYVKNTTFYNKKFDKEIYKEIVKEFKKKKSFTLSKNVISLRFKK